MSSGDSAPSPDKPRRRRRAAAQAKDEILAAAEERLIRDGPDGLRLQTIAADLGISHSAILHHFGSRDALLQALSAHALQALNREIVEQLRGQASDEDETADLFERIFSTLGDRGHAKLLAWRLLSGRDSAGPPEGGTLAEVTRVLHERRVESAREHGLPPPTERDSQFSVLLIALALFGDGLAGEQLAANVGLAPDAARRADFRRWLSDRIITNLFPAAGSGSGSG